MSNLSRRSATSRARRRRNASGVTLVELMVSAAVGLLLVGGILQLFLSSRLSYTSNEAVARVQENGRYAIHLLTNETRAARSLGCRSTALEEAEETLNVLACDLRENPSLCNSGGATVIDTDAPIGFDAAAYATSGAWLDPLPGDAMIGAEASVRRNWLRGDILVTWGTLGNGTFVTVGADAADDLTNPLQDDLTGSIKLTETSTSLKGGRLALISDCEGSDLFKITNPKEEDRPSELQHAIDFDSRQVNTSDALARFYNRIGSGSTPGARIRARVFPFEYKIFFVCCTDTRPLDISPRAGQLSKCDDPTLATRYRPALCRWDPVFGSQQIVPEIADMRITYDGILDPDDPASGSVATRFSELEDTALTAEWVTTRGYWPNVRSAFVELLVTSPNAVKAADSPPNPAAEVAEDLGYGLPNDRHHYQIFSTGIALRPLTPWAVSP